MPRLLPLLAYLAFFLYTLVAMIQTPESGHKGIPKMVWILALCAVPLLGGLLWWFIGREAHVTGPRLPHRGRDARPRPKGPDDDPDFLKGL